MHVSNITIYPAGTRGDPVLFETLADAREFSRISRRLIWAGIAGSADGAYSFRIWPGGRTEQFPRNSRLVRRAK